MGPALPQPALGCAAVVPPPPAEPPPPPAELPPPPAAPPLLLPALLLPALGLPPVPAVALVPPWGLLCPPVVTALPATPLELVPALAPALETEPAAPGLPAVDPPAPKSGSGSSTLQATKLQAHAKMPPTAAEERRSDERESVCIDPQWETRRGSVTQKRQNIG